MMFALSNCHCLFYLLSFSVNRSRSFRRITSSKTNPRRISVKSMPISDPIDNPLHRLVSRIVSRSSRTLSGVAFVSAVGFEIPPVEKGSFDNVFLPRTVRRSLDVDTRSEVETPEWSRRSLNRSKTQPGMRTAVCALPCCSHEEKSPGPLRWSSLPVSKSIKSTETCGTFFLIKDIGTRPPLKIRVFSQFVLTGEPFCSRFWRPSDKTEEILEENM